MVLRSSYKILRHPHLPMHVAVPQLPVIREEGLQGLVDCEIPPKRSEALPLLLTNLHRWIFPSDLQFQQKSVQLRIDDNISLQGFATSCNNLLTLCLRDQKGDRGSQANRKEELLMCEMANFSINAMFE